MRQKFRFLTVLAVCVMVLSCFSVTAFAYADDTDQNLPVTEATQPEQQMCIRDRTIPYVEMCRDGICKVNSRLYTKSIAFEDINYQLAQNEVDGGIFLHDSPSRKLG